MNRIWTLVLGLATIVSSSRVDAVEILTEQSRNFRIVTDLSADETKELLQRLETMLVSVSGYWGRRLPKPIDMYVAKNVSEWPDEVIGKMSPDGVLSIRSGGGLTITQTASLGGRKVDSRSVVYAVANRGTPQHEAVHAYCGLAFGATGPVWYAEGMAEVGNYWQTDDPAGVHARQEIIDYLRNSEPKSLQEAVSANQVTGDSWQNYAWRWALCHQLGFNPNYSQRFKPLGLSLLAEDNVTFADVYGTQAEEIEFEYHLFVKNLEEGYRADLCAWDWNRKVKPMRRTGVTITVDARRGWQAQNYSVEARDAFQVTSDGSWSVDDDTKCDLDGADDGRGRLVACIFSDGEISDEVELGKDTKFIAPQSGQLVLRCRDNWGAIADNKGKAKVRVVPVTE